MTLGEILKNNASRQVYYFDRAYGMLLGDVKDFSFERNEDARISRKGYVSYKNKLTGQWTKFGQIL